MVGTCTYSSRTLSRWSRSSGENPSPKATSHPMATIVAMPMILVPRVPVPSPGPDRTSVGVVWSPVSVGSVVVMSDSWGGWWGMELVAFVSFVDQRPELQGSADTEGHGEDDQQAHPGPAVRHQRTCRAERCFERSCCSDQDGRHRWEREQREQRLATREPCGKASVQGTHRGEHARRGDQGYDKQHSPGGRDRLAVQHD